MSDKREAAELRARLAEAEKVIAAAQDIFDDWSNCRQPRWPSLGEALAAYRSREERDARYDYS